MKLERLLNMDRNRIIYLLGLWVVTGLFSSCNDFDNTFDFAPKVQFSVGDTTLLESELTLNVDVQLVGPQIGNPVVVGFETSGSALEGRDYTISADNSVTIAPNTSTTGFTISILNDAMFVEDTVVLVLTIISASEGISEGIEGEDRKQLTITIVEDDCAIDWLVGTFDVTTTNTQPAGCNNVNNVVTITQVGENTFAFTDVTGGLYKNCLNFSDNPGELILEGGMLRMINQPDQVVPPFNDVFNGEGTLETCDQTITLTWSNGFGDSGTSLYRRRN